MAKKEMTKEITGKTIADEERNYTFKILKHKDGVKLQHKYASLAVTAYNHFTGIFQSHVDAMEDKDAGKEPVESEFKGSVGDVLAMIPQIFTWERTEELAEKLLAGVVVSGEKDDGEKFSYTADKDGFCELFSEDILEFYTAILYAAMANFPKYLLPFLDTDDEDSIQDS